MKHENSYRKLFYTFFIPEKIDDLFNFTFPPITSGARKKSPDASSSKVIDGGGGVDLVFSYIFVPPKKVIDLVVLIV
jgi:hypothetical protein